MAAAVVIGVMMSGSAIAIPVTITFQVNVSKKYDYVTGSYVAISPISRQGSFTFDDVVTSITDFGRTTITTFGGTAMGTVWVSPLASTFPADPFSGGYGPFYDSYTFPNVVDDPSVFIEEGASQANTQASTGSGFSTYHIELRARKDSAPRNGNGTSDYAFTPVSILDFYQSFAVSGAPVYFDEFYYIYDQATSTYLSGTQYEDGGATIVSVRSAASVPEPATLTLFGAGIIGLGALRRRRRQCPV